MKAAVIAWASVELAGRPALLREVLETLEHAPEEVERRPRYLAPEQRAAMRPASRWQA